MRKAVRAIIIKDGQLLLMYRNRFGQEYYNLVGGGIDFNETAEMSLIREVKEETGIEFQNPRLVIVQEAGDLYGTQYVYLCDYVNGEPALAPDSPEASINSIGKNLYRPLWLPIEKFGEVPFVAEILRRSIINGLKNGFPDQPIVLHGI